MEELFLPQEILDFVKDKSFYKDSTGLSGADIYIFDDMVLKISGDKFEAEYEHGMLKLFESSDLFPQIICFLQENGLNYTLMTKIEGKMSCCEEFMRNPDFLLKAVTDGLKSLWNVDITDICGIKRLEDKLSDAKYRVEHGFVDVEDAEEGTFSENGFKNPEELLSWLFEHRPIEDLVLSHGDFCLPNVFIDNGKFSGFVDVGRMSICDRWNDIAICLRSLRSNFSGRYNGINYPGFDEDKFFSLLGIEPDYEKIKYFILLDELF